MWRLRWKDTWLCHGKIRRTAAFLAKMAQNRIPRHTGDTKAWVHLHQSVSDSWHQNRCHIHLKCHFFHLVTLRQITYPKSKVCHPDICIYILLFPVLNVQILMHMPKIASVIKILIQICWLMKGHPQVSPLSAAWYCSWHQFCRQQQLIEQTWQRRLALI